MNVLGLTNEELIDAYSSVIKELKKEAKAANKVFLATDPDREGEAISWHIASQLGIPASAECRVTFNEITKSAVNLADRDTGDRFYG